MPPRTAAEARPRTRLDLERAIRGAVRKINAGADPQITIDDAFRRLYGPARDLCGAIGFQALVEQHTTDISATD